MQKERTITVTFGDEEAPEDMPIYFMEFINEAARVINARKEKEKKIREVS